MTDTYEPRLVIFSGAGLSAESGIPTFRTGDDALWDGHNLEEVCYLPKFKENYDIVHDFYNARRAELAGKLPNAGHEQIAKWEQEFGADRVINLTTNIDVLLEDAGCTNVHHIHGRGDQFIRDYNFTTNEGVRLQSCGTGRVEYEHYRNQGEFVKPNVVFFGEAKLHTENGVEDLYKHYGDVMMGLRPKDIFVVVGASFCVVPVHIHCCGAPHKCINVNPFYGHGDDNGDADAVTFAQFFDKQLREPAGTGLPMLDESIREMMNG